MRNACSLPSSRARAAVASVTARSVCSRWSYRSARWTRSSALDDSKPHICAGFFDLDEAGLPDGASLDAGAWTPYLNGIGFGSFLLAYSDAVLDAIDTSCTGENLKHYDAGLGHVDAGVLACYAPFVGCATSVARSYLDAHPVPSVGDDEAILAACVPDASARGD
jgi:hypothetical protein